MTTSLDTTVLAAVLTGRIVGPQDAEWDTARAAWNLSVDQRPAFVAQVATAEDVAEIIRFARRAGLRVAPQGTGHNAAAMGDLAGTVLLRTDALREVTVDAERRTVRVGAGVLWGEVTAALAPHGLTALAGSSADVGVAGYLLGGGYSWLAREHGLGASSITAVELVTGDGEFVRADADCHPELFWAVRGAGANIGVVTALEFAVLPLTEVYAGMLMFPMARAADVLRTYSAWTEDLTDAATTCIRLLRFPPLPELPPFLSGQQLCVIDGAIDLPAEEAVELLAPLRALGPTMDTFGVLPTVALDQLHMDPPGPVPGVGDGFLLDAFDESVIEALLAVVGPDAPSALMMVDLRHLGGAAGRPDPRGGVVDSLPGRFLGFTGGMAPFPAAAEAVHAGIAALRQALAPWLSARDYGNFREAKAGDRLFPADALLRLRAVRDTYNADRVVRANHELD